MGPVSADAGLTCSAGFSSTTLASDVSWLAVAASDEPFLLERFAVSATS
jgi:hypothetical protein